MKSEIVYEREEPSYPCLKINKEVEYDFIILFFDEETGVVVLDADPNNPYEVGYYSNSWLKEEFVPHPGKVILSN